MKNKISISLLTTFLVAGLFLFLGFGCKGLSTTEQQLTKPVTLEYWTVFDDVDALRASVAKFNATHPQITVNIRQIREADLYPRLVEALAEDRGPDIISIKNRWLKTFQSKLAPMPATVNDTTVVVQKGQFSTQTIVNNNPKAMVNLLSLDREYVKVVKDDVVIGGQIYGLPLSLDTMAVYYNKDILDRSGVPEPPKNWDEFQAAVKKINKYDKKTNKIIQSGTALGTGSNITGADDILYALFRQSGVAFSAKSGQAQFNLGSGGRDEETPAMAVLNFYTDYANATRDTYAWNDTMGNALDQFVNGSVGFFFGYSYNYAQIQARAPQLNFEVLPLFQLNSEKPVNVANYWIQTVVGKSKKQNEAWNLIDFLTHSTVTKDYLTTTGRPTALRAFISAQKEKTELLPFVSDVLIAENWYRGSNYEAAVKAINDLLRDWLVPGPDDKSTTEWRRTLLNNAAAKINQTI